MEVACGRGAAGSEGTTTAWGPSCPGAAGKCMRLGGLGWAHIQHVLMHQGNQKVAMISEKRVEAGIWWHSPSGLESECP